MDKDPLDAFFRDWFISKGILVVACATAGVVVAYLLVK